MTKIWQAFGIDIGHHDSWAPDNVNGPGWNDKVEAALTKISTTNTGMALFRAIRDAPNRLTIVPMSMSVCNAFTGPLGGMARHSQRDTGIAFDPNVYLLDSDCFKKMHRDDPKTNRGSLPDEVLFHEMVHGLRRMIGVAEVRDLRQGLYQYDTLEEFLAVVIANVYISDRSNRHGSGLRRNHEGHEPLENTLSTSLTFYKSSSQVLPLIKEFSIKQPDFFQALTKIDARFNPFAAFRECERAIKSMSASRMAHNRDVQGDFNATVRDVWGAVKEFGEEQRRAQQRKAVGPGYHPYHAPPLPPVDFGKLAKETLGPLAQQALKVLQR